MKEWEEKSVVCGNQFRSLGERKKFFPCIIIFTIEKVSEMKGAGAGTGRERGLEEDGRKEREKKKNVGSDG